MKRLIPLLSFVLLASFLAACSPDKQSEESNEKLNIYTSIYPLEFLAETIGGDYVEVTSVFPPGVDSHTYEPTTKEIGAIARGDMFIYMGAGMEGFTDKVEDTLSNSDVDFLKISDDSDLFIREQSKGHSHHLDENTKDPHIWIDPLRMIKMAEIVRDELIEIDPQHKKDYEANFTTVEQSLMKLDLDFTNTLKDKKDKYILVSHAAYSYWEERYDINQIPISGLFNDEPSQKDLADITRLSKEHNIQYIIFEQSGPDRLGEIVQEQLDIDELVIHNLETRTEKDLENNLDYLDLMENNLNVLDQATQ